MQLQAIGEVICCYKEKFGIPRQPGLVTSAVGQVQMYPPFDNEQAFDGLQSSSHIWIQFWFHQNHDNQWRPKVRPPRLGGNQSIGVFATRSPYRPNPLGLSVVRYLGVEKSGGKLYLNYEGGDLLHGTPVLDIKPYIPYADSVDGAYNTLASNPPEAIPVVFSSEAARSCQNRRALPDLLLLIRQVLSQDPRPGYHQNGGDRIYGMRIEDVNVRWRVCPDVQALAFEVVSVTPVAC